jgi:hypothetical protein
VIPGSFDIETCREAVGHARANFVEAKARHDAETDLFEPPVSVIVQYWDEVVSTMLKKLYYSAHDKRYKRLQRMKHAD